MTAKNQFVKPDLNAWEIASKISDRYGIIQFADLIVRLDIIITEQQSEIDDLEKQAERFARRARSLDSVREIVLDIAHGLANAGSYDHKTKNEAILTAIARLFAIYRNYAPRGTMPENDDVPF